MRWTNPSVTRLPWLTGGAISLILASLMVAQRVPSPPATSTLPNKVVFAIHGRVISDIPNGVPDILEVRLQHLGVDIEQDFIHSDHSFEFRDLPPGNYNISIQAEKFKDVNQSVDLYGNNPMTFYMDVFLSPKNERRVEKVEADDELSDAVSVKLLATKIPGKAMKHYRMSLELDRAGKTPAAISELQKAIAISPDFYSAQRNLGLLYFRLDQPEQAIPHLQAALKLFPSSAKVNYYLGLLDVRKGELQPALAYFQKAISLAPDKAAPYYFQGYIFYKMNRLDEAEKSLKRAFSLDPLVKSYSRLQLANVYLKKYQLDEAYREMENFLREQPTAPEVSQVMSNLKILRQMLPASPDPPSPH